VAAVNAAARPVLRRTTVS